MKYIKTKDGKIWSFSNPNNIFLYEEGDKDKKNGKWVHEIGEVVKEADTIEELCDDFVAGQEDHATPVLSEKDKDEMMKDIITLGEAAGIKYWRETCRKEN